MDSLPLVYQIILVTVLRSRAQGAPLLYNIQSIPDNSNPRANSNQNRSPLEKSRLLASETLNFGFPIDVL